MVVFDFQCDGAIIEQPPRSARRQGERLERRPVGELPDDSPAGAPDRLRRPPESGILAALPQIVAVVMPAPLVPVELREFPEPVLEPGSLLLRRLYSEVCDTDVHEAHHAAIPWRAIGAQIYALSELNQALADAEAMRLPKALVKPN